MKKLLSITLLLYLLAACSSVSQPEMLCPESPAQMCTMEYMPVCARLNQEVTCESDSCEELTNKTYSNGCRACQNPQVLGYDLGACDEPAKPGKSSLLL